MQTPDPVDIPGTKVLATMFDGRIVHDVVYDLGDSESVDLDALDVSVERPML
jgi:hypothetical protein